MKYATKMADTLHEILVLIDQVIALPESTIFVEDTPIKGHMNIEPLHDILHDMSDKLFCTSLMSCGIDPDDTEATERFEQLTTDQQRHEVNEGLDAEGNRAKICGSLVASVNSTISPILLAACHADHEDRAMVLTGIPEVFKSLRHPIKDILAFISIMSTLSNPDDVETIIETCKQNYLFTEGRFKLDTDAMLDNIDQHGNLIPRDDDNPLT